VLEMQQFITSEEIIAEIIAYIRTTRPKSPHKWSRELHRRLLDHAKDFDRTPGHHKLRDINDVHVVQLAIEHSAIIITSDNDLLEYKDSAKTAILSVAEYNELFIH
jgi:predicted nucleic acid-binding protein